MRVFWRRGLRARLCMRSFSPNDSYVELLAGDLGLLEVLIGTWEKLGNDLGYLDV
jgi:hypothetical protein